MKKNFQIIILVVFMAAAVVGVLVFSGAIPLGKDDTSATGGTVTIWGPVKAQIINPLLENFNLTNTDFTVKYVEKSPNSFDNDLLEAFASGKGPDMFFITEDLVYKYSNKIFVIPYESFPLSTFKGSFLGAGEVFLTSKGILAFPLTVDPMMLYYSRSMLDANAITYPPVYWDEFTELVPRLTQKDDKGAIIKSGVALGQFANVSHAKYILSTLLMQMGNMIIADKDGLFVSLLNENKGGVDMSAILKFYTGFADPAKNVYSWNRSFASSRDAFSNENLAFYFGFASELSFLANKNPNQNFQVASVPQVKGSNFKLTNAHVMGIAVASASKNFNTALTASGLLAKDEFASKLATSLGVAPARRDFIKTLPTDAYSPTFYASALYARSWLDPSARDTNNIFQRMVESVLSNSMTERDALNDASAKLDLLLIPK